MISKTITDRAGDTLCLSTGSLTAGPGEITVKVSERFRGREEVAAVHVDPAALRAALDEVAPAGSYARTDEPLGAYERHESPDYADGGVAAALIEKEADTRTREHILHEESRLLNLERSLRSHLSRTINRAEKAERERDEALYQRDQWKRGSDSTRDILDEAIEERRRIARALDLPENATADAMVKHAAESRPLTPDAITDEMVKRAWHRALDFPTLSSATRSAIFAVLVAALTEPPARPEGAEDVAVRLFQAGAAVGVKMTEEQRDALADHLAAMHVRVVGGEDPR